MIVAFLLLVLAAQSPQPGHADHQPRLAGTFAAAADDTLHLEAFLFPDNLFRVIVSDRSGQPLASDRLRVLSLRVDGRDTSLQLLDDSGTFEAAIPMPPDMSGPGPITIAMASPGRAAEMVTFRFTSFNTPDSQLVLVPPTEVPGTLAGILDMLRAESRETQAMLDSQPNHGVYISVTRVRDLALAMEAYVATLPALDRTRATAAIREAVRVSWLAHAAADNGLPHHTRLGVILMRNAIAELRAAFGDGGNA